MHGGAPGPARWALLSRWALLLCVLVAGAWTARELGRQRLDTDLFALIPAEGDALLAQATAAGRRDVLFWLHADAGATADLVQARDGLRAALLASGLFEAEDARDRLLRLLPAYRHQLLDDADRAALQAGDEAAVLARALERIASPMPGGEIASFELDPLGTYERALLARLDSVARLGNAGAGGEVLRVRLRGDAFDIDLQARAEAVVRAGIAAAERAHPGVRVEATGLLRHAAANAERAREGTQRVATLSSVLVLGMALWAFRRPRPVLLAFVPVLAGTALGYAAALLLFPRLHVLTLVFGATLVGSASDYAFHFLCARTSGPDGAAPSRAQDVQLARRLLGPLCWSAGSAALGYACMAAAGVGALAQVAVIGGVGLVGAAASILLWFPWLCLRLPAPRVVLPAPLAWLRQMSPNLALALTGVLAVVSAGTLLVVGRIGDDLRVLDASPPALLQETARVNAAAAGLEPGVFLLVRAADAQALLAQEHALRVRLDALVGQGVLEGYVALSQLLPSQARQREDFAALQRLWRAGGPAEAQLREMGAEAWLERWRGDAPASPRPGLDLTGPGSEAVSELLAGLWLGAAVAGAGEGARVDGVASVVRLRGVRSLPALRAEFAPAATGARAGTPVSAAPAAVLVDVPVRLAGTFALLTQRALLALAAALGVIALGLALWRRAAGGARGILPIAVSVLAALALAGALRGATDLFQVLGAFLVLALATDFVILTQSEDDPQTVLGMLLGALSTGGAFLLLVLLPIPAVQGMGCVVAAGTLLALLLTTALRRWLCAAPAPAARPA